MKPLDEMLSKTQTQAPSRNSQLSFDSGPPLHALSPTNYAFDKSNPNAALGGGGPSFLQRNKTERFRLQGLMHTMRSVRNAAQGSVEGHVPSEELGRWGKVKVWMVNEGE